MLCAVRKRDTYLYPIVCEGQCVIYHFDTRSLFWVVVNPAMRDIAPVMTMSEKEKSQSTRITRDIVTASER